jgi:hypothetical protein
MKRPSKGVNRSARRGPSQIAPRLSLNRLGIKKIGRDANRIPPRNSNSKTIRSRYSGEPPTCKWLKSRKVA